MLQRNLRRQAASSTFCLSTHLPASAPIALPRSAAGGPILACRLCGDMRWGTVSMHRLALAGIT